MIITRTPYRISFFGGGTDYPAWYRQEGGAVLSATIDKYCTISARYLPHFFDTRHRIVWSHIENVNSINEILHPAVKGALQMLAFDDTRGVEIHHQGDLPARTGIGSSSSFSVGLIHALLTLRGQHPDKQMLAQKALYLEQDILKENVGSQDQIAAAYGGFNQISFEPSGDYRVMPLHLPTDRQRQLEESLILLHTGSSRLGGEIAAAVIAGLDARRTHLHKMRQLVDEAKAILTGSDDLSSFGSLLDETWRLKRELAPGISNPEVDAIYATARAHGALGGKLLGAGARGFMLFFALPQAQARLREALSRFLCVPFRFEHSGSALIQSSLEANR
jgi:D-glycero-alpha-D-manno-heptose-7-phosphate kinase